jgi:enamine deaminase RidA (YjgF/YER057c/UK114 family)
MRRVAIAATDAPPAIGGYTQALKVEGARTLVFVSGQVPVDTAGHTPPDFAGQCRLVWRNVEAQLRAAGLRLDDIVKVTTFLADRRDADANGAIRREMLGSHAPALTVVFAGIFDQDWKLEIEVIAAA